MVTVSSAWQSIYNAISANVSDPKSRGTKWIFGAHPDVYAKDFPGFPVIVIHPDDFSKQNISISGDNLKRHTFKIEVFSKSAQEADSLVDSVISAIDSVMYARKIQSVGSYDIDLSGSVIHVRPLVVRYGDYS